jgi:hypothetical protein
MLLIMLPCRTGNGTAESVLAVAHQGTIADHQGAVVDHQSPATDCQHTNAIRQDAAVDRQGAAVDCQGAVAGHQGVAVDCQGATADRQGVVTSRQDVVDLAALRPKKALATRCVDDGGHRSRHMNLHAGPTVCVKFVTMIYSRGGHKIERTMVTHET